MKRKSLADLQRQWAVEARSADLSLWWMSRDVRQKLGPRASEEDIRARTLELLRPLLDAGELQAAGLLPGGTFIEWKGAVEDQLRRIDSDWRALGRQPGIGDVVWFIRGPNAVRGGGGAARRVLSSLVLGAVTSVAIRLAEAYGPNTHLARSILDALVKPGAVILGAVLSGSPHAGRVVPYWGYAVGVTNFVVYSSAWLVVLLMFRSRR